MKRIALINSIMLVAASVAFAQSDEEVLETLRTLITETFREQISDNLPESFQNSGLAPADKERLMLQLSNDYVACFEDAVVEYAAVNDVPLSDLVSSDGTIHFDGNSGTDFEQLLVPCLQAARQGAGLIK